MAILDDAIHSRRKTWEPANRWHIPLAKAGMAALIVAVGIALIIFAAVL